jgi:hypothetical protein
MADVSELVRRKFSPGCSYPPTVIERGGWEAVRRIAKEGASAWLIEGERVEGARVEGERVEGERVEGEKVEGARVEGERREGAGRRRTNGGASAFLVERQNEEERASVGVDAVRRTANLDSVRRTATRSAARSRTSRTPILDFVLSGKERAGDS